MSEAESARERADRVRGMFGRIVPRYDLMNRLMTAGLDRGWRRATGAAARPAGAVALDLATGTGDLALELREQGARVVVGADFSEPMLARASAKLLSHAADRIALIAADALALPFPDDKFDCLTSAFLLRNVVDLPGALGEMYRVLRSGGRAVSLELTHLEPGLKSKLFDIYFQGVVPRVGAIVAGDASAYSYLPASLDPFPEANTLSGLYRAAGFAEVQVRRVGFGALAIHRGVKP